MTDEDKIKLIEFYKCNPCLWDSTYQGKKKAKAKAKGLLFEQFEGKYSIDCTEKTFRNLQVAMVRELKKHSEGKVPSKKWKFFDYLEFVRSDFNPKKTSQFNYDDTEHEIQFYREHSSLWDHSVHDYRDRNL